MFSAGCDISRALSAQFAASRKGAAMKAMLFVLTLSLMLPLAGREPLAFRIAHTDPARYRHSPSVHGGPGALDYMA
jgi:hypothetical protein